MSFKDFNDEGPGTFAWDYVLGQNTTGLFPDETHYIIECDVLEEVIFKYAGGETWETLVSDCWNITDMQESADGDIFFKRDGTSYKATVYRKLCMRDGQTLYDIVQL